MLHLASNLPAAVSDPAVQPVAQRYSEIDGIRGWAALVVVLFHFFAETFGALSPSLRSPWTGFIFDGRLAVYVFFVLSGDALAVGYLATRRRNVLDRLVVKRYFRLTIPIVIACTATYLLLRFQLVYSQAAAVIIHRPDWLGQFVSFEPDFLQMIRYALWDVYGNHQIASSYNPFMWTMSIEMIGSLAVFAFLYASPSLKAPGRCAAAVAVFLLVLTSWYAMFFLGIALGYLRVTGYLTRARASSGVQLLSTVLIFGTVIAVSLEHDRLGYAGNQRFYFDALAAGILVSCFYVNRIALRAFRARTSQWLGTISFPLYLIHFCILISLTSCLIVRVETLSRSAIALIAMTSVLASLVAAAIFHVAERWLLKKLDALIKARVLLSQT